MGRAPCEGCSLHTGRREKFCRLGLLILAPPPPLPHWAGWETEAREGVGHLEVVHPSLTLKVGCRVGGTAPGPGGAGPPHLEGNLEWARLGPSPSCTAS